MKEKILALLVKKFAGARKDGLTQLAGSLALQAATDEEAQALVEKLTEQQVTEYIREYRATVDKEVTTSTTTHENNLKIKYDFVEKGKKDPPKKTEEPTDPVPAYVQEILESNKKLLERIDNIESGKMSESRKAILEEKLKDVNPALKGKILKDFDRMKFEKNEDFEAYLTETETDIATFVQDEANRSLTPFGKPNLGGGGDNQKASKEEIEDIVNELV